jgi:acyl-CoA hydrolase
VFVAVDDDMRPTEVPDLAVGSDRCRDLREEALDGEHE